MYLGGKKSPCGSALGRTELKKYMFYVSKTQKSRFSIFQKYNLLFWENIQIWLPPQIGLLTSLSDGKSKNLASVSQIYVFGVKLSILPRGDLQVQMGPTIKIIRKSEIWQKLENVAYSENLSIRRAPREAKNWEFSL